MKTNVLDLFDLISTIQSDYKIKITFKSLIYSITKEI